MQAGKPLCETMPVLDDFRFANYYTQSWLESGPLKNGFWHSILTIADLLKAGHEKQGLSSCRRTKTEAGETLKLLSKRD